METSQIGFAQVVNYVVVVPINRVLCYYAMRELRYRCAAFHSRAPPHMTNETTDQSEAENARGCAVDESDVTF